jgi:myo-inositol 2-dehydrogenase/D-chiro-inositol 1-dehydrogenase
MLGRFGRVRIGVIGVGRMGEQHIRNVVRLAGRGELAALHDVDNSRALSLAASCGGPAIFEDPRELIASEDVDAILVASPDATHRRWCSLASMLASPSCARSRWPRI